MTTASQVKPFGPPPSGIVLWVLTAGLLLALWGSVSFAVLAGLDVVHHYNPSCRLVRWVEVAEAGLRHWASHVCAIVAILFICMACVFCKRHGREVAKTTVVVLFLAVVLGATCILLGSALSSMVPNAVQFGP